jgi:hypothetical protein
MAMVRAKSNPILFPQQNYFVGCGKQIWPTPHPCKCKQVQDLPIFYDFPRIGTRGTRGGDPNEQSKVEDDTQSKMDSHLIIIPLERFFDNELKKIVIWL